MNTVRSDLQADFFELRTLCGHALKRLISHVEKIRTTPAAYSALTQAHLLDDAARLQERYVLLQAAIDAEVERLRAGDVPSTVVLSQRKRQFQETLRMLQSSLGSVLSAGEWQSPSVLYSGHSEAGKETGSVQAYESDYKRDKHIDAVAYAQRFVAEYVDHPYRLAPSAFVTSSGMSAVLTTLSYLVPKIPPDAVVLAGATTYFQSKWILEALFPRRVRYTVESDEREIVRIAKELRPSIVFFDTLSNNAFNMPNLDVLLQGLVDVLPHTSTIVLDNTGLGVTCQPLRSFPITLHGARLIVVESLSKYHQFGLDRVSGGIVWSPFGLSVPALQTAHTHLGTILPDVSVLAQPVPDRALLEVRLARIGRNALHLARRIHETVESNKTPLSEVIYPGLPSHPAYIQNPKQFYGGFFVCEFASHVVTNLQKDSLVKKIFEEAKKRNLSLVLGAGFGFNTTRVYILPAISDVQHSILRISAGTETLEEINALGDAIIAAMM